MLQDVLKESRATLNLKQADIAEYVGVTTQTYMKWENGKNEPKASNVKKLAEILKVTEKEICSGELIKHLDSPVPFMTELSKLKLFVSDIDMMITIFEHVEDEIEFLKALHKCSAMPQELQNK